MMQRGRGLILLLACAAAAACSNSGLRNLESNNRGPDEFLIEPKGELEIPSDLNDLPAPTPGLSNRTDQDPLDDAVTNLGGRSGDPNAPIPSSDGALVTAASRYGVSPNIRQELAAEDAEFRRKQSRFTQYKLFPQDLYNDVYSNQALDARATANAWRNVGTRTPSYPPAQ
ncbi:MAG: DUF3035 domain-containing protein [Pseudomonadota bacterium]